MEKDIFVPTRKAMDEMLEEKFNEILEKKIPKLIRKANRKPYLTTSDFKELFGVSSRLQKHYRDNCGLPYIQEGKKIFYKTDEVEEWLEKRRVNKST